MPLVKRKGANYIPLFPMISMNLLYTKESRCAGLSKL